MEGIGRGRERGQGGLTRSRKTRAGVGAGGWVKGWSRWRIGPVEGGEHGGIWRRSLGCPWACLLASRKAQLGGIRRVRIFLSSPSAPLGSWARDLGWPWRNLLESARGRLGVC